MTDYHCFEGRIEPIEWGNAIYTVLRLPSDVSAALDELGAKRVEGEIADHPVNLALTKAPVIDGTFLWTGKSLLEQLNIEPGQQVDVRLRPANPAEFDTPDDVAAAIRAADLTETWNGLTPGKCRSHLYQVNSAKRADTRARRIAKLIETLRSS